MKGCSLKLLFIVSLSVISCLYGIIAAQCQVFPYSVVRDAMLAAQALGHIYVDDASSPTLDRIGATSTEATVRNHANLPAEDLFLISGGVGYLPQESSTGSCLAWVMDRNGRIRHVWEYAPSIWDDLQSVKVAPLNSEIRPIGLHLYEDGGLLVSFQGLNTWPYAIGLARYDKDSQLLWKRELLNHHWFSVADNGDIYVCALRIVESPHPIGNTEAVITSDDGKVSDDTLMILDSKGNVREEISMLEALFDSGWVGLFQGATGLKINAYTRDPTHFNDVRLVPKQVANRHEWLSEGDLLVSFRSLNTIGILDGTTKRFKWLSAGATIRQHSPRFLGDSVLVFDNRGGNAATGGSRLVQIDLKTRLPKTVFPLPSGPVPDDLFFTDVAGHLDVLPPDRVLVALSEAGDVWEIDLATGEVCWQYTYVDPNTRSRRPIYTAKYLHDVNFPMNRAQD